MSQPSNPNPSSKANYIRFSDKFSDSLTDITGIVQQNKDMIDTTQDVALELTGTVETLHVITVKYAGTPTEFWICCYQ